MYLRCNFMSREECRRPGKKRKAYRKTWPGPDSTTTRNRSPVGSPSLSPVSSPSTPLHPPLAQTCLTVRSWQAGSKGAALELCLDGATGSSHLAESW